MAAALAALGILAILAIRGGYVRRESNKVTGATTLELVVAGAAVLALVAALLIGMVGSPHSDRGCVSYARGPEIGDC